jgi:glucose/arabinose dehydrogenase
LGVLGICVDPAFSVNHFVYAYYNHNYNGYEAIRIVRFTEAGNAGTNPVVIFDHNVTGLVTGAHAGGNIRMHASEPDKLYFAIGNFASTSAVLLSSPFGKMLRINSDGTIPADNPFMMTAIRSQVMTTAYGVRGHRNPFDFCFSPVNDSIYCSENGQVTWDEANIIRKGANYGWLTCEGKLYKWINNNALWNYRFYKPDNRLGSTGNPAVTGIMVYNSPVIPQLNTHMLVASYTNGNIYDCTLGNPPAYNIVTSNVIWQNVTTNLTTLKQGADGCIYTMKGGYSTQGAVYRICPSSGVSVEDHFTYLTEAEIVPNPSNGFAEIRINLAKSDYVAIYITDLANREVISLPGKHMDAGPHHIHADHIKLESGTYFCHIKTTKENRVLKLMIEK